MRTHDKIIFDLLRALAALLVLGGHARALVWPQYSSLQESTLIQDMFYFATGLGHQAVIVFFVLSGFLISDSIMTALYANTWRWKEYAINRLCRLWMVLIPCLLLTLVWDALALRLSGTQVYTGVYFADLSSGPLPGEYDAGLLTFARNLAFLQTITGPVYGSNSPLWSLANEFWYYVLFPLACLGMVVRMPLLPRLLYAGLFVAGLWLLPAPIIALGLVWLCGSAAAAVVRCSRSGTVLDSWLFRLLALGALIAAIILARLRMLPALPADLAVGAACALVLISVSQLRSIGAWPDRLIRKLANMSYTIYLVHFPFLLFLYAIFIEGQGSRQGVAAFTSFLILVLVSLIYSHGVYLLFERHTVRVRQYLHSRFSNHRESLPDTSGPQTVKVDPGP